MKLTPQIALKQTRDLWTWLSQNPGENKIDAPFHWVKAYAHNCPCCEYVCQKANFARAGTMPCHSPSSPEFDAAIKLCPMRHAWPNGCGYLSSPYYAWEDSGHSDAMSAQEIANAAEFGIKRIRKNTK